MASHGNTEYGTAQGNDYEEHQGTYNLFVQLVKWGLIANVIILAFMFFFLT